jgi:hypothetical protein
LRVVWDGPDDPAHADQTSRHTCPLPYLPGHLANPSHTARSLVIVFQFRAVVGAPTALSIT